LIRKYGVDRNELFICTKNGYIPVSINIFNNDKDDADKGVPAATLIQEMLENKLVIKI